MNQLRDYQLEMLSRLNKAWKRSRSVMVQMPTGTGKTHLMAAVIRSPLLLPQGGGPVLVVAHRHELIEQISRTLDGFGVEHGLIVSGKESDYSQKVQVASIQTLARRLHPTPNPSQGGKPTPNPSQGEGDFFPSLVVVDEAHHAQARTYRMLWERWPKARFLGLTATPCRMSGESFAGLFDVLIQSQPITAFIKQGWLSDFEYVSVRPDSLVMGNVRRLKKRGADGDYQTKEMATVLDVPESIEHLYNSYHTYARGKKGIVYAIDRQHARHIAEYYQAHGVRCAVIDAKTPAGERERLIKGLSPGPSFLPCKPAELERPTYGRLPVAFLKERGVNNSTLDVLVNVDIFSEGFDCPEVEFIQLARPTLSLSKYLQQVGRGMRISEGKPHVLILDNVGLYQTFGLPTEERDWRATFYGQAKGKGLADSSRMVVLDEEWQSTTTLQDSDERRKELINLQMVRIKKGGKRGAGLEIFLQDGKYGVMRNGRITTPARFKRMERLRGDCGFFALGVYMIRNEYNSGKLTEVTTVIDKKGQDLQVRLYGEVCWEDGYFCGVSMLGSYAYVNCWDPVGNSYYYDTHPDFQKVAGVEIGWANEHHQTDYHCRKLRYNTGRVSPRFDEWEMFFNRCIVIARDYLIVKRDRNHSYRISGYLGNSILVESDEDFGYQQIFLDGRKGELFRRMPDGCTRVMNSSRLGLQRVKSKG